MLPSEPTHAISSKQGGVQRKRMVPENIKSRFAGALLLNERWDYSRTDLLRDADEGIASGVGAIQTRAACSRTAVQTGVPDWGPDHGTRSQIH